MSYLVLVFEFEDQIQHILYKTDPISTSFFLALAEEILFSFMLMIFQLFFGMIFFWHLRFLNRVLLIQISAMKEFLLTFYSHFVFIAIFYSHHSGNFQ